MTRTSDRLFIDKETKKYYDFIKKEYSHLNLTNSDLFKLALIIGYNNGLKKALNRKIAFILHRTIPTDFFSIIILLAIKEYGVDEEWINNPLNLFDLAEQYANAGIEILMENIKHYDFNLDDFLTSNILELYSDVDFKSKHEKFIKKSDEI